MFRYIHVIVAIMWIGLLWYFNFVQIPNMGKIPDEQKPAIGKVIAPAALFYFRWAAAITVLSGLILAYLNGDGILQLNEWFMRGDVVVLSTPEVAGLPYVISGLVAAGGMAAAMSTADGLILAIANALSHDIYYKIIDPKADVRKRLLVARSLLIVIGAAGAYIASMRITSILGAVAWSILILLVLI